MSKVKRVVNAINGVFAKYGGIAAVLYKHPKTGARIATVADTYVGLPVFTMPNIDYSKITGKHLEIQDAVGRAMGERVLVRYGYYPFSIEVPRTSPDYTELVLSDKLRPFESLLGRAYTYGKQQLLTINLTHPNEANVFVAGQVGSGKSNLIEGMLLSMAHCTPPELLSVYLIDMKKRSLSQLDSLPHVAAAGYDEESAYHVCKTVFDEIIARRNSNANTDHRVVLFVDELRELKFGSAQILDEWLPRIVALGRELGVHVVAATQKPNSEDLGPIVNSMFSVRIAGNVESPHASYHTLKRKGAGADKLLGRGDMLLAKIGQDPIRMQAFMVEARDEKGDTIKTARDYARHVVAKWPAVAHRRTLVAPADKTMAAESLSEHDKAMAAAREVWGEVYDPETGKLRARGQTVIAEAIFGKGQRLEGHYYRVTQKVIRELMEGEKHG